MQRGATYPRRDRDCYNTPYDVVRALLGFRVFRKTLCDPCCGAGNMLVVFEEFGYAPWGFDILPWGNIPQLDFLSDDLPTFGVEFDIVTNPPFGAQGKQAEAVIRRAIETVRPWRGKVCMLLAVDFDSAKTRRYLFKQCPIFSEKIVLHDRIVWFPRDDGERVNPAGNWAWFVWDWKHDGEPTTDYL